jgi:hypothetical protein
MIRWDLGVRLDLQWPHETTAITTVSFQPNLKNRLIVRQKEIETRNLNRVSDPELH